MDTTTAIIMGVMFVFFGGFGALLLYAHRQSQKSEEAQRAFAEANQYGFDTELPLSRLDAPWTQHLCFQRTRGPLSCVTQGETGGTKFVAFTHTATGVGGRSGDTSSGVALEANLGDVPELYVVPTGLTGFARSAAAAGAKLLGLELVEGVLGPEHLVFARPGAAAETYLAKLGTHLVQRDLAIGTMPGFLLLFPRASGVHIDTGEVFDDGDEILRTLSAGLSLRGKLQPDHTEADDDPGRAGPDRVRES